MEFFAVFILLYCSLGQIIRAFFIIEEQEKIERIFREILIAQDTTSRRLARMEKKIDKRNKNNE